MCSLLYSNARGAPWVQSPKKSISTFLPKIKVPDKAVVVELGCGTGRVLRSLCSNPKSHGLGVDINPILILIARLISSYQNKQNCDFIVGDVYSFNLQNADIIYLFLMPKMLDKLRVKFEREPRKGTLIISLGFKIPQWDNKNYKIIKGQPYNTYLYKT